MKNKVWARMLMKDEEKGKQMKRRNKTIKRRRTGGGRQGVRGDQQEF